MTDDSRCPRVKYCDFLVLVDAEDAQVEVCKACGKKVIYNKRDGRIDNAKYLRDHYRDFMQRSNPEFEATYGEDFTRHRDVQESNYIEQKSGKELAFEQGQHEAKEALRIWKKLDGKGGHSQKELEQEMKISSL